MGTSLLETRFSFVFRSNKPPLQTITSLRFFPLVLFVSSKKCAIPTYLAEIAVKWYHKTTKQKSVTTICSDTPPIINLI